MSNAAIAMDGRAAVTPTELSWKFIRWGFGLFITGFLTGSPLPEMWVRTFLKTLRSDGAVRQCWRS